MYSIFLNLVRNTAFIDKLYKISEYNIVINFSHHLLLLYIGY